MPPTGGGGGGGGGGAGAAVAGATVEKVAVAGVTARVTYWMTGGAGGMAR